MPEPRPSGERPAVFLDRDGTVIEEVSYLAHPDQVHLLPSATRAIRRLNELHIPVVVVTNQAGVARGYFPESRVAEVHARLDELLAQEGARIDGYYVCPHHPTHGVGAFRTECQCRKPNPGLLLRAASELDLLLARSCMIGDKLSDLEAGARAGCRPVLVRTGYGAGIDPADIPADWGVLGIAAALDAAIELWLSK
jgi:D-glycero-D-manno-heptose 1,7-bisphosphate phosphatase